MDRILIWVEQQGEDAIGAKVAADARFVFSRHPRYELAPDAGAAQLVVVLVTAEAPRRHDGALTSAVTFALLTSTSWPTTLLNLALFVVPSDGVSQAAADVFMSTEVAVQRALSA